MQALHYHPFLFALITLVAMAELGLAAWLVSSKSLDFPRFNHRYYSMLDMILFDAVWTTVFSTAYMLWIIAGAVHILASIASSAIWLLITSILWGVAAGIMHDNRIGGACSGTPALSRCRQALTAEALGWTAFGLCLLTLITTIVWARGSRKSYRDSFYASP